MDKKTILFTAEDVMKYLKNDSYTVSYSVGNSRFVKIEQVKIMLPITTYELITILSHVVAVDQA